MADPLSIPTTILPGSTYDPVQFAKERRQEVLTEQKERRTRYNEAWNSVPMPSGINSNVSADILKRKNDWMDRAASKGADGVDIFDISNPKTGKDAMQIRSELDQIRLDATKTIALDKYLGEVRNMIAKDDKEVINQEATKANITKIQGMKSMKEIDDFLSSKGDDIVEVNKIPLDENKFIYDYLKETGVKGMPTEYTTNEGGFQVSREYNNISPEELKNSFMGMLNVPKFKERVKEIRASDATDLRGGSDLEYLMERKGNRMLRQQTAFRSKPIEPKAPKEGDKPKYQVSNEPVKSTIFYGTNSDKTYTAVGKNPVTFDQSKTVTIPAGLGVIDIRTGQKIVTPDNVEITPINTAEYYVADKPTKFPNGVKLGPGGILPDGDYSKFPNVKKKRFVQAAYSEGSGENKQNKTVFIPYENIKNELDAVYKMAGDIPETKNEVALSTEDQQAYDWANKNPNDPRAKQILKLLNKK
jgi:hypothetical protein